MLLVVALACVARGAEPAGPALPETRWGVMPETVIGARVAPDGRVWWQMRPERGMAQPKGEQFKEMLAREFGSESPQLTWATPVHMELGSPARVWVAYGYSSEIDPEGVSVLLGYDGKTWATRGRPGRTSWTQTVRGEGLRAVSAGGIAFFPGAVNVERFDGAEWTVDDFSVAGAAVAAPPVLTVETDGRGVLAAVSYARANGTRFGLLWRFHEGVWTRLPAISEEAALVIRSVAGGGRGAWALVSDALPGGGAGSGVKVVYAAYEQTPVGQLLAQLKAAEFATREAASVELIHRGEPAAKAVHEALAGAEDQEAKYRLEFIRSRIERGAAGGSACVGLFDVVSPRQLIAAADGRAFLRAQVAAGPERGAAIVLLLDRDGTWKRCLTGDAESRLWSVSGSLLQEPIFVDGGRRVWLHDGVAPARLLDLQEKKIVHTFHASYGDRLLAQAGSRLLVQGPGPSVRVFAPDQPDTRGAMDLAEAAAGNVFGISADGTVWSHDARRGLVRFDATSGRAAWVAEERLASIRPGSTILAGRGNVALCDAGGWTLVTPGNVWSGAKLETLIAERAAEIAAAFGGARPFRSGEAATVVAGPGGAIWLLRGREMRVLIRGQWVEADLARSGGGKPYMMAGVGDGSRVYVICVNASTGHYRGVLARIEDGAVVAESVTAPASSLGISRYLYDHDGALWVETGDRGRPGAVRLTSTGIGARVMDVSPVIVDGANQLWVRPVQRTADVPALAIRRGEINEALPEIPATGIRRFLPLGANRVGVWSELGVHVLKADGGGKYAKDAVLRPPMEWMPAQAEAVSEWLLLSGQRLESPEHILQPARVK